MAGLIINTIKGKYIQLHPGQVLMKDSRRAGLFHLSPVVGQNLCAAACFAFCSNSSFSLLSHAEARFITLVFISQACGGTHPKLSA